MPPRKTFPASVLLKRAHQIREQAAEQQKCIVLNESACRHHRSKSAELCRHSDELLRKSRGLQEKLRKMCRAS